MSIRVGVIGLEYGGQIHVPAYKEDPKYELVAICSRTLERAEAFAREHSIPRWYADPRQMIASDIDLVSIATLPPTHAGLVAAALARKRHVVCEVAFMPSAADANIVTEMVRATGTVGAAAFVLRYKPHIRLVSDLLQRGAIGRPILLCFDHFSNLLAAPDEATRWMWDADNGGGVLASYVSHALDFAQRWFGPVREVEATLGRLSRVTLPTGILNLADDSGSLTLHFESGPIGMFRHSAVTALPRTSFEIHGTEGTLLIDGFGDEVSVLRMGADAPEPQYPPIPYLEQTRGHAGLPGAFSVFLDDLAEAISNGRTTSDLPTFRDGLNVTRVIEAARRAAREGRRVEVER